MYASSKKGSVPEETVRRWVVKSPSHQEPGRSSYLKNEEEMCVVVALQFLGQCGFLFDRRDVLFLLNSKNANLKIKRKRALSKTGEVLTKECFGKVGC
ncbi:uncharacterized protein TNCV_4432731 [Trichonephila clavipes]|nr:uncharacterized protein TNCV_4432731 [Trichonephila clavipes]